VKNLGVGGVYKTDVLGVKNSAKTRFVLQIGTTPGNEKDINKTRRGLGQR